VLCGNNEIKEFPCFHTTHPMIIPSRDENLKTVMKQTGRHICLSGAQNTSVSCVNG